MPNGLEAQQPRYTVRSVLGKKIRTTPAYLQRIRTIKHPELTDNLEEIFKTLAEAEEVRRSEPDIYLYYRRVEHQWLVAVARHLNGDGFLVTVYRTSKIKRKGTRIWQRKK